MNKLVRNSSRMYSASFWRDKDGNHPDVLSLVNKHNVTVDLDDAINGKWCASKPELRSDAMAWVISNVRFDSPLIIR